MATNEAGESGTSIICSCKQTRFHISDPVYQELDVEGLTVQITSANASSKAKSKSKTDGLEILTNASLKLKPGVHYALIGRNGTGKSTLLKAIAEKLIPGIPLPTRIAILQQTQDTVKTADKAGNEQMTHMSNLSVLEDVVDKAISKETIQQEIDVLLPALNSGDPCALLHAGRRVKLARMKQQHFWLDKDARLRSGARGLQARKALVAFEKQLEAFADTVEEPESDISPEALKDGSETAHDLLVELQAKLEPTKLAGVEVSARGVLKGLGFHESQFGKAVGSLSGGWRMRASLASALLTDSDILILDEPTNFLDILGLLWLQRYLVNMQTRSKTTVLLVSHDRDFLNSVMQEMILIKDKDLTYFRGDLDSYERERRSKIINLRKMQDAQDKQKQHIQKTIQQNIKQGKATGDDNKLRQAKSRQKKLDDRMGLNVSAGGGRFKLNRDLAGYHLKARAEIDVPEEERAVSIVLPMAPDLRFPGPLLSLENIDLKYKAAASATLQNANLVVHWGDRIGLVGENGSGKSTLIKLITEKIKPSKGTVTKHPRLRLGYYSQHAVEDLQKLGHKDETLTALSLLTKDVDGELDEGEIRGLLGSLGLPGRTASDVPVIKLSGGQLVRLALAQILWRQPQLLVLDEITTHLDFYTVTALSNALSGWNGAILVVSHDRYMIRRVVEGEKPDQEEEDDSEDSDEEDTVRRRDVYMLKGGKLSLQTSGVSGFEQSLEKRIAKLMLS